MASSRGVINAKLTASAAAAYFAIVSVNLATPVEYSVRDLGSVTGVALNDRGQVTGYGYTTHNPSGVFITGINGVGLRGLGPFPATDVLASGINNSGQVCGTFFEPHFSHPFVTGPNGAAPRDLGINGSAFYINNRGQVAGTAYAAANKQAVFLTNENGTSMTFQPFPGNGRSGTTAAFNNLGQVVVDQGGWPHPGHAFITGPNAGPFQPVRSPLRNIFVNDVNDRGQFVGYSPVSDIPDGHGFVGDPGTRTFTDFTVLFPNTFSDATAINNAGVVVGSMWPEIFGNYTPHAFVYTALDGLQDLNSLIDPTLGIELNGAIDINERGQILVSAGDFYPHTYLLTPSNISVPDQGSAIMLLGISLVSMTSIALWRCYAKGEVSQ